MHKFKPGQKVVRISEWVCNNPLWLGKPIYKGQVLTVREILNNGEGLLFEEILNPIEDGEEFRYHSRDFAPLIETDQFVEVTFEKVTKHAPVGAN